ncbi:restriction endonuclease subunit S [Enterococcus faecalis]|uniref:restriction endonuclease subunit S n=1 Tax=Enterococcus faecalis TaxID=1351 RepID=UPI003F9387E1
MGEVSEIRTGPFGSTLHAEDYVKDGFPIITTEHFKNGELPESKDNVPQVSAEDYNRLKSYTLNEEDIVFSRVGSVDLNALVSKAQSRWLFSGRVLRVRSNNRINSQYLHYELSTTRAKNDVISRAVGQTMPSINTEILKSTSIYFPKFTDEQYKIGVFFKKLDDTITLHQRKLDQLKELKKAYLQVMFPGKDERVPKLRFADFEEEWEQCKFFDMWEKSSDRNKELKYSSKDVLSVAKMTKNPVERNSSDEYMKTYNILHYGDIAFEGNKSKDYSFGRFVLNNLQDGIVSHVFIVFKPKVKMDIDFMKVYINNEYFMKHHLVKATTKTLMMTTLNVQDMNKQKLRIPSLNEQERIGKFFKELDHAITLHQNKLTQLNSLKKSYLQNMFI